MAAESTLDGLTCQQIFALLSEYLDSELPANLCETLSAHIHGCAPCVKFVESLRKSIALCNQLQVEEKPGALPADAYAELKRAYEDLSKHAR